MTKSKETFVQLIQANKGILVKICNSYCTSKSDRDDLGQEIVFNLWKAFAHYTADHKFATWMYRIGLNVAISFYRKELRSPRFAAYSEDLIVFEEENEKSREEERHLAVLRLLILELQPIDKSIMLLYLEKMSYQEIAEIVGITETNVATKINRIKNNLRAKIKSIEK